MSFLLDMLRAFVMSDLGALLSAVFVAYYIVTSFRSPVEVDDEEWEASQW